MKPECIIYSLPSKGPYGNTRSGCSNSNSTRMRRKRVYRLRL